MIIRTLVGAAAPMNTSKKNKYTYNIKENLESIYSLAP
jgi:hypothetical protein